MFFQDSSSALAKNFIRFFAIFAIFFIYSYFFNGLADLLISPSPQHSPLAQVLSSTNLAPNSSFESSPCATGGGWLAAYSSPVSCGVAPFLWSTTQAHSGTHSVEITNPTIPTGASHARWLSSSSLTSAQAGKTYQGSLWVKTQNAQGGVEVAMNFWNGSAHLQTFSAIPSIGATQDWTLVTVSGTAPVGTTNARIELRRYGAGGQTLSGTVLMDDVTIQEVTSGTPTPPPSSPGALPSPWISQDIGAVVLAGSATYLAGAFTVNGGGSDIFGTTDSFYFVHQQLTGDGEIQARVVSVENTSPYARAGVMMRESLTANSRHALMAVKPNALLEFLRRVSTGGSTSYALGNTAPAPRWVRLVRSGSTITAYESSNGTGWTLVGSDTFASLPATIYVGLAVGGLNTSNINTSVFDGVIVTQTVVSPPPVVPPPPPISTTGTIYYISPTGSDANSGLSALAPKKSFGQYFNASKPLKAGDTLVLMNGIYTIPTTGLPDINCTSNANNGIAAQPIMIKAQNERQATLKDTGARNAFLMQNCSYYTIEGLRAQNQDLSTASGNSTVGHVFRFVNSSRLTIRRNIGAYNNRYTNSHIFTVEDSADSLLEENEAYYAHRHSFSIWQSERVTLRRNYANARSRPDISGGYISHINGGDDGIEFYNSSYSLAENNILERTEGMQAIAETNTAFGNPGGQGNQFFGDVVVRGSISGGSAGRNSAAGNTTYKNIVAAVDSPNGFLSQSAAGTLFENATIYNVTGNQWGGGIGIFAKSNTSNFRRCPLDPEASTKGSVASCSFIARNVLAFSNSLFGISSQYQNSWLVEFTNLYGNGGNFECVGSQCNQSELPISALWADMIGNIQKSMSVAPTGMGLGANQCLLWIPAHSNMKGAGKNGADIGANILYRYQDGALTSQPLWHMSTGAYPCGVAVYDISDPSYPLVTNDMMGSTVATESCTNVHRRLNVNTNGCLFPTGYGQGISPTPPPPPPDTTAPIISNVVVSNVTTNSATIAWSTDEPSTSRVEYGISTAYGSQTSLDSTLATSHPALITGLLPNTTYNYRVTSQDASGNIAISLNRTFQTSSLPDTQGPAAVSNLSSSNTTQVSARLMWAAPADQPAGQVLVYDIRYSISPITQSNFAGAIAVSGEPVPSAPGIEDAYTLVGLQPSTLYYVAIKSQDVLGNVSLISNVITFTTESPVPVAFDFTLSHGGSRTVMQGNEVTNTITATLLAGSTEQITFSVSGLPLGATAAFGQASCSPNCQTIITIDTQLSTPIGQSTVVVSATVASITRTVSFMLTVEAAPPSYIPPPPASFDFALSNSGDVSVTKGDRVASTITASLSAGVVQPVSFSVAGLPDGVTASFGQTVCNPSCQTTLTLQTQSATPEGSSMVTVIATGGGATKISSFALTVKAPSQTVQSGGGGGSAGGTSGGGGGGGGMIFDSTPPSSPSQLQVFGGPDFIFLLWQNPQDLDFVRTIIVRKEGSAPTSVTDGAMIYEGIAKEFIDTKVQKGKTYYYALYSFDQRVNYSQSTTSSSYLGKHTEQEIAFAQNIFTQSSKQKTPIQIKGIIITKYLQVGSRHPEVAVLQKYLQDLGFFSKTQLPTGFFGSMTARALKSYQVSKGIEPAGVTGPKTRKALRGDASVQAISPVQKWLVLGSRGEDVRVLQTILKRNGYSPSESAVNGYFDAATRASLGRFQCATLQVCSGAPETTGYGATGPKTRRALGQLP